MTRKRLTSIFEKNIGDKTEMLENLIIEYKEYIKVLNEGDFAIFNSNPCNGVSQDSVMYKTFEFECVGGKKVIRRLEIPLSKKIDSSKIKENNCKGKITSDKYSTYYIYHESEYQNLIDDKICTIKEQLIECQNTLRILNDKKDEIFAKVKELDNLFEEIYSDLILMGNLTHDENYLNDLLKR